MVERPPRVDRSGRRINRLDEFKTPNKNIPKKEIENIFCECTTSRIQEVSAKITGGNTGFGDSTGNRCICKVGKERVKVQSINISQTDFGGNPQERGTEDPNLE